MSDRIIFSTMTPEAKQFYARVFNTAILNIYAVRNGLFDTLFCETDDPTVISRWRLAVPGIIQHIEERKARDQKPK